MNMKLVVKVAQVFDFELNYSEIAEGEIVFEREVIVVV